jgi:sRNA-binding protein
MVAATRQRIKYHLIFKVSPANTVLGIGIFQDAPEEAQKRTDLNKTSFSRGSTSLRPSIDSLTPYFRRINGARLVLVVVRMEAERVRLIA